MVYIYSDRELTSNRAELLKDKEFLSEARENLRSSTVEDKNRVGMLSEQLEQDELNWKKKLAEVRGAYKQAKKQLKIRTKEANVLRKQLKKKDSHINSLVHNLR